MSKPNPGKAKVNAIGGAVKAKELFGGKPIIPDELTETEMTQVQVMLERLNALQAQLQETNQALQKVDAATRNLIGSIVQARGRDPMKFGVNLAAGRILPIDPTPQPVVIPPSDGDKPEQIEALKEELKGQ